MSQVADNTRLFRGQGQVFLAKRVSGQPAGLEFVGKRIGNYVKSPDRKNRTYRKPNR